MEDLFSSNLSVQYISTMDVQVECERVYGDMGIWKCSFVFGEQVHHWHVK